MDSCQRVEHKVCRRCQEQFTGRYRKQIFCSRACGQNGPVGYVKPGLGPTVSPTRTDIVWASGIYEGEGHSYSHAKTTGVTVCQKDRWLLVRLRERFGGSITKPEKHSGCSYWKISGSRARGFLLTIYQFLSPRRKVQALRAMSLPVPESLSL